MGNAAVAVDRDAGGGEGVYTHTLAPAALRGGGVAPASSAVGALAHPPRGGGAVGDDGAAAGGGGGGAAARRCACRCVTAGRSRRGARRDELLVGARGATRWSTRAGSRCRSTEQVVASSPGGGPPDAPTPSSSRARRRHGRRVGRRRRVADGGATSILAGRRPKLPRCSSGAPSRCWAARSAGKDFSRLSTADGTQDVVGLLIREAVGGRVGAAVRPPPKMAPSWCRGRPSTSRSITPLLRRGRRRDVEAVATAEPPFSSSFGIGATLSSDGEWGGRRGGPNRVRRRRHGGDGGEQAIGGGLQGYHAACAPLGCRSSSRSRRRRKPRLAGRGDQGGAADFHGELTAGVPTTVCASEFDALGRRFLA